MEKAEIVTMVERMTSAVIDMAKKSCWNLLSDNYVYVIHGIDEGEGAGGWKASIKRKRIQLTQLKLLTQEELIEQLYQQYKELNLIECYVFRSEKERTIIEFQIRDQQQYFQYDLKERGPYQHCKLPLPPYKDDFDKKNKKFDLNWKFGTAEFRRNMFWWRLKFRWRYFWHRMRFK